MPLVLIRGGFGEDVSEEGFQDRHAAAYEAGVDFDDAGTEGVSGGCLG